jgi:hypothetical protein
VKLASCDLLDPFQGFRMAIAEVVKYDNFMPGVK